MSFRLTYATMFNPPEEMHRRFEEALVAVRSRLGQAHVLHVAGGHAFSIASVVIWSESDEFWL